MNAFSSDVVSAQSVDARVATYQDAIAKIRAAMLCIHEQHKRIDAAIGPDASISLQRGHEYIRWDDPDPHIKQMDRWAWQRIVQLSGIRKVLSVDAARKMDHQMEHEKLPDITPESVKGLLATLRDKAPDYLAESVREVHDWLRPTGDRFRTNTQYDIGKRVILAGVVRKNCGGGYSPSYMRDSDARFRALENVFYMLDGKALAGSYHGPLVAAMHTAMDGAGETEHFRFRCYGNGNLHLEFRRSDLVAKLNAIAGGNMLYAGGAR